MYIYIIYCIYVSNNSDAFHRGLNVAKHGDPKMRRSDPPVPGLDVSEVENFNVALVSRSLAVSFSVEAPTHWWVVAIDLSRWWQLKYSHPESPRGNDPFFDEHIFQMGLVKNHHRLIVVLLLFLFEIKRCDLRGIELRFIIFKRNRIETHNSYQRYQTLTISSNNKHQSDASEKKGGLTWPS